MEENRNQIKFSILIPAYKSRFLKEAIESVLGQSYKNLELIVVDDCSPEDLKSIVDGFSDSRMSYYRNEKNCGAVNVVDNWNKCLSYATGDYVICMGDDDKLTTTCLADYIEIINKYPGLNVYHTRTVLIDKNSEVWNIQELRPEYESGISLWWHRWNGRDKQYIGDFLFFKKHLDDVGGFLNLPLAWASDDLTALRAALPYGIANVSKIGFCYRSSMLTISMSADESIKALSAFKEMEYCKKILSELKPVDEVDRILLKLINIIFDSHFKYKFLDNFLKDIDAHPSNILFWWKHREQFRLSKKILLRTYFNTLRYSINKALYRLIH